MVHINSENVNHLLDFWDVNPLFNLYPPFNKLKDNKDSSKLMWFIVLMQYPDEEVNIFFRISEEERRKILEENLVKPDYSDQVFDQCYNAFPFECLSAVQRALKEETEVLVKRSRLIRDTDLTLDSTDENGKPIKGTATQINILQKDAPKVYEQYEKLKEKFIAEKQSMKGKGGAKLSKTEQGQFWNVNQK